MSDQSVGSTGNTGNVGGTSGASSGPVPSPEQIQANLDTEKAKLTKDLNNLNTNISTTKGLQDQTTRNIQYAQDLKNLNSQLNALKASNAPEADTNSLEAQIKDLKTTLNQLIYGTESVLFSDLQVLGFSTSTPSSKVTSTGLPPVLPAPLSNGNSQKLSAQSVAALKNSVAAWLGPNLITAIFAIMEEVVKQKIQNIDTYRQFQWNSIAGTEAAALSAAQSQLLEGQLEAASQRAQAAGQLAAGIIGMSLGFLSIGATFMKIRSIHAEYDAKINALKSQHPEPIDLDKQINDLTNARQSHIQNTLQSDPWLRTLTVGEQTFAQIAQGIGTMIGAGYTSEAAYAKAAAMLWQQMIQCEQNITQDMSQAIQGAVQDIQGILQAFGSISSSVTGQSGR